MRRSQFVPALALATAGLMAGSVAMAQDASFPPAGSSPLKIGVVTDVGTLDDKNFNEFSWNGAILGAQMIGAAEPQAIVTTASADYAKNIQTFLDQDYDVIVTIGFALGQDTAAADTAESGAAAPAAAREPAAPYVASMAPVPKASDVAALETGRETPRASAHFDDPWRENARKVADCLGESPERLWPEHAPHTPRLLRERPATPEEQYVAAETDEMVRRAVSSLSLRRQEVLSRRYGIGREAETMESIAECWGITKQRVQQLESEAIDELRLVISRITSDR